MITGWQQPPAGPVAFEVRMDSPDGKLLGQGTMSAPAGKNTGKITVRIDPVADASFHTIYFVKKAGEQQEQAPVGVAAVKFKGR